MGSRNARCDGIVGTMGRAGIYQSLPFVNHDRSAIFPALVPPSTEIAVDNSIGRPLIHAAESEHSRAELLINFLSSWTVRRLDRARPHLSRIRPQAVG